jgi:hypothetical protein
MLFFFNLDGKVNKFTAFSQISFSVHGFIICFNVIF